MPRPHRPRPGRRSATPPRAPTAMAPGAGPARPAHPLRARTRTRGRSWVVVRRRSQIAHPRRDRACAAPWKHLPWLARRVPSAREPGVAQAVTALASPFRRTIPFPRKRARQANRTGSVDHGSFPPRVPCRHVGSPGSALARSPCQPPPATSGSRRRCRSCPGACAPCGRLWQPRLMPGRQGAKSRAHVMPSCACKWIVDGTCLGQDVHDPDRTARCPVRPRSAASWRSGSTNSRAELCSR